VSLYITILRTDRPVSELPLVADSASTPGQGAGAPASAGTLDPRLARALSDGYAVLELDYDEQADWHEAWKNGGGRPTPSVVPALREHGIEIVQDDHRVPPIFGSLGYLDLLVQATPALTGALAVVLAAWLQKRGNHRVRMKVGDKEFEARDADELQRLVGMALAFEGTSAPATDRERVARLAHELWAMRGRPDGSPEVDWNRAEELLARYRRG
jgi:hypothetical protein